MVAVRKDRVGVRTVEHVFDSKDHQSLILGVLSANKKEDTARHNRGHLLLWRDMVVHWMWDLSLGRTGPGRRGRDNR